MAKILIVEDNALNIKLFCDLLAAHGHEPKAVTDSRNAIEAARELSPDLVITDIQLPHVSGLDLIRLIRADEKLAEVPIMAVTASGSCPCAARRSQNNLMFSALSSTIRIFANFASFPRFAHF